MGISEILDALIEVMLETIEPRECFLISEPCLQRFPILAMATAQSACSSCVFDAAPNPL